MSAHSSFGFSGQGRIISCPGSVRMQRGMPNTTNDAAELGTAVHECSEFALTWGVDCSELVGLSFNGIKITEGMAYAGQQYVTYVNKILEQRPNAKLLIEKRVALSSIDAGNLWGTSDCIIIDGGSLITRSMEGCQFQISLSLFRKADPLSRAGEVIRIRL